MMGDVMGAGADILMLSSIPSEVMGMDTGKVKSPEVSQGETRCWLSPPG